MKKLTPNQQLYQKEVKRIRRNLSKLRSQGYDVSELAKKYNSKLPSRVTSKMLKELHNITPKKLKLELNQTEAIRWTTYAPKKGSKLETPFEEWRLKPEYSYLDSDNYRYERDKEDILSDVLKSADRWGYSDYAEETIPDFEPEETYTEPDEQEEEHFTQKVVDEEKGKVYTIDVETGEIIEEADLYIEEDEEGNELYINGDTGDIVGINKFAKYNIPDMNDYAMEMLYDIVNQFPLNYQQPMRNALDKMIEQKGLSAVADAFTQTMSNRPNMLDKLSNAREKYNEAVALLEEMADILDVPINLKQDIKDYVYRESMADIETYGT